MAPRDEDQDMASTLAFLSETDAQETSGPRLEEELDEERDETGAPLGFNPFDLANLGSNLKKLQDGDGKVSVGQAKAVAAKHAATTAKRRAPLNLNLNRAPENRQTTAFRRDLFSDYKKTHKGAIERPTFYYSEVEILLTGESTAAGVTAGFYIDPTANATVTDGTPTRFKGFNYAIDDDLTRMGVAAAQKATPAETNLAQLGRGLYRDEMMVIEHLSLEYSGMRIDYDHAAIDVLAAVPSITAQQARALKGLYVLEDDAGIFAPVELYNEYADIRRVVQAVNKSAVIAFAWNKNKGGGSTSFDETVIKPLQDVPMRGIGINLAESSGGAGLSALDPGYLMTLNANAQDRYGLFEARINIFNPVYFPIKTVKIPSSGALIAPTKLAIYFRLTIRGQSIRPADSEILQGKK